MAVRSLRRSECGHCGRTCYEQGRVMSIEAARRLDGGEPAEDYLRKLEKSPGHGQSNIRKLAAIAICFETFANTGELARPRELNDLEDDILEIKGDAARLPFYLLTDNSHGQVARIVGGFDKREWRTPRKHIRDAIWVRGQDVQWTRAGG